MLAPFRGAGLARPARWSATRCSPPRSRSRHASGMPERSPRRRADGRSPGWQRRATPPLVADGSLHAHGPSVMMFRHHRGRPSLHGIGRAGTSVLGRGCDVRSSNHAPPGSRSSQRQDPAPPARTRIGDPAGPAGRGSGRRRVPRMTPGSPSGTIGTVAWVGDAIEIIDQTRLPATCEVLRLETVEAAIDAIRRLAVRGAPAIGVCGAFAIVLGLDEARPASRAEAVAVLDDLVARVGSARPTAVNLSWAVHRVHDAAAAEPTAAAIRERALGEAQRILDEDREACRRIGELGRVELRAASRILTHCNAGRLATAGWGTALGVVYAKAAAGEPVQVFACEARPLLQGARLTAWELMDAGIDVTLIVDGAAAPLLHSGRVDAVVVGADRIAANGDTANKVGTFGLALAARHAGVPFYVAAPGSTFDLATPSGDAIVIEERTADEVRGWQGHASAPRDVPAWNPAFDVTPHELVTAFITEAGVLRPPFVALSGAGPGATGGGADAASAARDLVHTPVRDSRAERAPRGARRIGA